MNTWNDFVLWERNSRDTIDFKKIYVDIADGDLVAGLMLSELVYWYLPNSEAENKLRVTHQGEQWIAVRRYEWWERTRISPKQADRAIDVLKKCNLIITELFKFDGSPTVHIRINKSIFTETLQRLNNTPSTNPFLPKGENGYYPKVKMDIDQTVKTLTKTTTKTTNKETTLSSEMTADISATTDIATNREAVKNKAGTKQPKSNNAGYELGIVIGALLGIPATCMDVGYTLVGSGKRHKAVSDIFKAQPVTIEEFRAFYTWFQHKYQGLSLKSPLTIANHIADYRKIAFQSVTHVTPEIQPESTIIFY